MAVTEQHARSPDPRAPRRGRPRGEGQWALGHREPLNPNERIKKDDDPLNVRARIETIYAHRGFASIDPRRPARPVPLVGPLHPAQARHRRRPHRGARAARARRRVLHAARPHRRRPAQPGAAARRSPTISTRVRPRHRRHHRPAEHPAALDPDRGRAGRSGGGSRRSACRPPRPAATRPRVVLGSPVAGVAPRRGARPDPGDRRDRRAVHRRPGVLQPAAQVQDRRSPGWPTRPYEANDISFLGVDAPRARPRLRPLGRRRPVHQPDAGPAARRLGAAGTRSPTSGPAWSASSATTATAGCATGPG